MKAKELKNRNLFRIIDKDTKSEYWCLFQKVGNSKIKEGWIEMKAYNTCSNSKRGQMNGECEVVKYKLIKDLK